MSQYYRLLPQKARDPVILAAALLVGCALIVVLSACGSGSESAPSASATGGSAAAPTGTPALPPSSSLPQSLAPPTPTRISQPTAVPSPTSQPTQQGGSYELLPLDKSVALPADYAPSDLVAVPDAYAYGRGQLVRAEALRALQRMIDAGKADGVTNPR